MQCPWQQAQRLQSSQSCSTSGRHASEQARIFWSLCHQQTRSGRHRHRHRLFVTSSLEDVIAQRRTKVNVKEALRVQATLSGNGSGNGSTAAATAGNGVSLAELADRDKTVFVAETLLPTRHGDFRVRAYRHSVSRPAASRSALTS